MDNYILQEMSIHTGKDIHALRAELARGQKALESWSVAQLKGAIRCLRQRLPYCHGLKLTGSKKNLIQELLRATKTPKNGMRQEVNVEQLVDHPKFKSNRCPYIIDWQNLTAVGIIPGNSSEFKVKLSQDQVQMLHLPRRKRTLGLHLRLFSKDGQHGVWEHVAVHGINVYINKDFIPIHHSKQSKNQKKGHRVAKPLDISEKAAANMQIEIHCSTAFTGICVAELASFHATDEMIATVKRRCRGVSVGNKVCQICEKKTDLMRCSRCKTAWYCGEKHQQDHWATHRRLCQPYKDPPQLPRVTATTSDDDEIQLGESRVSLRCPLTIKRISTPVRGMNCHHPQCFDLRGYLENCCRTGLWQCPTCTNPCQFKDLGIDDEMEKILTTTGTEIDQVRLFPDGKYEPISLEEIRREHAGESINSKKRKRVESVNIIDDTPSPAPKKKSSVIAGASIEDAICLD